MLWLQIAVEIAIAVGAAKTFVKLPRKKNWNPKNIVQQELSAQNKPLKTNLILFAVPDRSNASPNEDLLEYLSRTTNN